MSICSLTIESYNSAEQMVVKTGHKLRRFTVSPQLHDQNSGAWQPTYLYDHRVCFNTPPISVRVATLHSALYPCCSPLIFTAFLHKVWPMRQFQALFISSGRKKMAKVHGAAGISSGCLTKGQQLPQQVHLDSIRGKIWRKQLGVVGQ